MNIVTLAKFFDCMRRADIMFSVEDVKTDFQNHFGVEQSAFLPSIETYEEIVKKREGTFLSVYVTRNSLNEDVLIDALRMYMKGLTWWLFESPYGENEVVYIVKLDDNEN